MLTLASRNMAKHHGLEVKITHTCSSVQRFDRVEAWEEWVEEEDESKEVIRVMSGTSKGILAKCIDAREDELEFFHSNNSEFGGRRETSADSDGNSNFGVDEPLRRAETVVAAATT